MSKRKPKRSARLADGHDRGSVGVAAALVLAAVLVVSVASVGMMAAGHGSSSVDSPSQSVDVIEEGLDFEIQSNNRRMAGGDGASLGGPPGKARGLDAVGFAGNGFLEGVNPTLRRNIKTHAVSVARQQSDGAEITKIEAADVITGVRIQSRAPGEYTITETITEEYEVEKTVVNHYEQVQVGTEKVQTGTKKVQVGTKRVRDGSKKVRVGEKKVQVGTKTETYQEYEQVGAEPIYEKRPVKVGEKKVPYDTGRDRKILTGYDERKVLKRWKEQVPTYDHEKVFETVDVKKTKYKTVTVKEVNPNWPTCKYDLTYPPCEKYIGEHKERVKYTVTEPEKVWTGEWKKVRTGTKTVHKSKWVMKKIPEYKWIDVIDWKKVDVYEKKKVQTGTRKVYGWVDKEREVPVYEWQPVYEWKPKYKHVPVHEQQPVFEQKPVYEQQPVYKDVTETKTREKDVSRTVSFAPLTANGNADWTLASGVSNQRDASLTISRETLTDDSSNAFEFVAEGADGSTWTLSAWRDGDAIVIETSAGVHQRIEAGSATIDFDEGTINGVDAGIHIASGIDSPYALEIHNGDEARGSYSLIVDGSAQVTGQSVDKAGDSPPINVVDGIVYSATFDVTYQSDTTTYSERVTVTPEVPDEEDEEG